MEPSPDSTTKLVARANLARARLSATLGALERRRRELVNLPALVQKHRAGLVIVAACAAGVLVYGVYHAAVEARRRRLGRWGRMQRAWMRPEPVKKPSAFGVLARALAGQLVRTMVARLVTFAMEAREEAGAQAAALPGAPPPEPSPSAL